MSTILLKQLNILASAPFPLPESAYGDSHLTNIWEILNHRLSLSPFNGIVSLIFLGAIIHTLSVGVFQKLSAHFNGRYYLQLKRGLRPPGSKSMVASLFKLLGEVEVVFGLWAIILSITFILRYNWHVFLTYIDSITFTEPLFILCVMTIASSRPILQFFEVVLWRIARWFGGSLDAWWLCILVLAPLLGSIITEPAAMTIAALLLAEKFYTLEPNKNFKYATLALLFVNVSIGGALTHFAAPPILMAADAWQWSSAYMFVHFGWKSVLAIAISTFCYYLIFKGELGRLHLVFERQRFKLHIQHRFISRSELEHDFDDLEKRVAKQTKFKEELDAYFSILRENIKTLAVERLSDKELSLYEIESAIEERFDEIKREQMLGTLPVLIEDKNSSEKFSDLDELSPYWNSREQRVPIAIMILDLSILLWTVFNNHAPAVFMAGFLLYLAYHEITFFYQNRLDLKPPLMVAFFIAGLMIHGNLQGWWISPLLSNMTAIPLNLTAIFLTSFNDNAAITYLSTLVPNLPDALKYAIVTGAITGGGLTLVANAPNPVGQSILRRFFENGISSGLLLKYAILPTTITALVFFIFKSV